MNWAHLHLILNHVPVLGLPAGLISLVISRKWEWKQRRVSYFIFIVMGLLALGTFASGFGAEEVLEKMNRPDLETWIEPHEESAAVSLVILLLVALLSGVALRLRDQVSKTQTYLQYSILFLALLGSLAVGYTANTGGKISHPEIRNTHEAGATRE